MKKGYTFNYSECPYCSNYQVADNWYKRHLQENHARELLE